MGKAEGIRVFLRIRPPASSKHSNFLSTSPADNASCQYEVDHTFEESNIRFHVGRREVGEVVNNTSENYQFAFRRVFDPQATQEEVFNVVAKDCVTSVLGGYNSTIFAYGQTGSGKTFSITGGTESYQDRGIIPRAMALVYDEVAKRTDCTWAVSISYLQIYNDRGQDLLNHGKDAKTLDDLPAVTVHEGEDEVTLRGLEQHSAPTLTDALNLLFLGDTNRLYCETPMNKTSSRSHCVFTVSLEARSVGSSVIRRSKLNLVDLAGSERVSKTGVAGTTLTEAKYINLSLHYLEHVIVALSEQAKGKRDHVPYRNSFMTMVLRDSLGGNCRTSMLATAHLAKSMLPETLSTCQFAQRVALIKQDARVNEVTDPLMLVRKLRAEVAQLKDRLAFHEKGDGGGADRELTDDEMSLCKAMVDTYVANADPQSRIEGFEGDLARIYYCFDVLRVIARSRGGGGGGDGEKGGGGDESRTLQGQLQKFREQVDGLQVSLQQKENEMNVLFEMLQQTQRMKANVETQTPTSEAEEGYVQRHMVDALALAQELRGGLGAAQQQRHHHEDESAQPAQATSLVAASTEAARAHVANLADKGKLTEAEATAAQEYFSRKEERLAEAYDLTTLTDAELLQDRTTAFDAFKQSYRHYAKVEATKSDLKAKYEQCKVTARDLNARVDAIRHTKALVQRLRAERAVDGVEAVDPEEAALLSRLGEEKESYNALAASLRSQKEEIDSMHAFMKRSQDQLARDFEDWLSTRQKQVATAVQGRPAAEGPRPTLAPYGGAGSPGLSTSTSALTGSGAGSSGLERYPSSAPAAAPRGSHTVRVPPLHRDSPGQLSERGGIAAMSVTLPAMERGGGNQWIPAGPTGVSGSSGLSLGLHSPRLVGPGTSGFAGATNTTSSTTLVKSSPSNPFHLQPLSTTAGAPAPSHSSLSGTPHGSFHNPSASVATAGLTAADALRNPYAPEHRSTGNVAADEQLAALYKAREEMRKQFQ